MSVNNVTNRPDDERSESIIATAFFNDEHQLRALWRILFFIVAFLVLFFGVMALLFALGLADAISRGWIGLFAERAIPLVVTGVATALAARATERRSFGEVGFALWPGWWREGLFGFAFGVAILSFAVLPNALAGWISGDLNGLEAELPVWLALWLIAAAFEELLVRGFVFQALITGIGAAPATLLTSAFFAALHLGNPNLSWIAIGNIFIAGILLSIAYLKTRSLWLATGVHLGWNFTMGSVLGLPVSGITGFQGGALNFREDAVLQSAEVGPDLATGGAFGPEGSLVALVVLVVSCVVLYYLPVPASGPVTEPAPRPVGPAEIAGQ